jgi:hypothetical protein
MAVQIRVRRGTAAQWTSANPTLLEGEVGVETDTSKLKVGDGVTVWASLAYQGPSDPIVDVSAVEKGGLVVGSAAGTITVLPVGADGTVLGVNPSDTATVGWVALNLDALSDVAVSAPSTGDLLQFNGSSWSNVTDVSVLTANRDALVALVWGEQTGYFSRGISTTTVYEWAFPTDIVSTTTAAPATMIAHAGFANPAVAGYFARGLDASFIATTTVYKWAFPVNTVSTTTTAPAAMGRNAGFANPAVAGYMSRGNTTTTVYKWSFPADTVSTTTVAPATMIQHAGFANPAVAGYFSQGSNAASIYKWSFPADTVSTSTAAPDGTNSNAGFSNPAVAGYFSRGYGSSYTSSTTVYKWAFPSDTVSTTTSAPAGMSNNAGFSNPAIAGYFNQGSNEVFQSGPTTNVVYKWAFPADAVSTTTPAPETMRGNAGFANGY